MGPSLIITTGTLYCGTRKEYNTAWKGLVSAKPLRLGAGIKSQTRCRNYWVKYNHLCDWCKIADEKILSSDLGVLEGEAHVFSTEGFRFKSVWWPPPDPPRRLFHPFPFWGTLNCTGSLHPCYVLTGLILATFCFLLLRETLNSFWGETTHRAKEGKWQRNALSVEKNATVTHFFVI